MLTQQNEHLQVEISLLDENMDTQFETLKVKTEYLELKIAMQNTQIESLTFEDNMFA